MRTLFLGNYDPGYARNRILVKGMVENGAEVVCCNGGSTGGIAKFLRLMVRYFKISDKHFDLVIVMFPPQQTMVAMAPILSFMRLFQRTPVIVDMLTSHYEGYILDRKKYSPQSFHAKWYKWLDRTAVRLADFAIVNCALGGKFLTDELGISAKKIITVFNGADDDLLKKSEKTNKFKDPREFLVNFHGNFMPLHGVPYIIQAANILKNENIKFQLVGRGHDYDASRKMAEDLGLKNIIWTGRIPYESLPAYINKADVCLGIFGDTSKTETVIPNKIFEVIAMGKAIITADTEAVRELFEDGENILFCRKADPNSLAGAILKLKNNTELMDKITQNSYALFTAKFSKKEIVKDLINTLKTKGYKL
jgi:glycosyltransferase involved in cell wall biosynthesis